MRRARPTLRGRCGHAEPAPRDLGGVTPCVQISHDAEIILLCCSRVGLVTDEVERAEDSLAPLAVDVCG